MSHAYGPLSIIEAVMGTDGSTVAVELPLAAFSGVHMPPGESATIEVTARVTVTGRKLTPEEFAAMLRPPMGPQIGFVHASRPGWTCTACTEQHPLLLSMRDIDRHLAEKHPSWREAGVETR